MSKPKNWYSMSDSERRDWQKQDAAREDAEYLAAESHARAEQAERNAESARRASMAARSEYEENAESCRSEIEELRETLTSVRAERDKLLAACKAAIAYDAAIEKRAMNGAVNIMATGGAVAMGDDLDALYDAWISSAREAVEYAEKNPA